MLKTIEELPGRRAEIEANLVIHSLAQIPMTYLPHWDQVEILSAVESLQHQSPDSWPEEKVVRLEEDKLVFLLRVSPDLRAFIGLSDAGAVELIDVVRTEVLELFHQQRQEASLRQ